MPMIRKERIPKSEIPKKGRGRSPKLATEVAYKGHFLLKKLYEIEGQGQEKKYLKQLAEDLGISMPKMSKTVKPLVDHGLVSLEWREKNDRRKFIKLTEEGRRLTMILMEAMKTPTQEEIVISEKDLKEVIKTLTDDGLGINVKKTAAYLLRDACSSAKFENRKLLQEFFSNVVDNIEKYVKDEFPDVLYSLEHYFGSQLRGEDVEWFSKVYKRLLSIFKSEAPINTRDCALRALGSIYKSGRKVAWMAIFVAELKKLFEDTFFDAEEDKDIAERCWNILGEQATNGELEDLMDRLYEGAKSQDKNLRVRCENRLIEVLKLRWKKSEPLGPQIR